MKKLIIGLMFVMACSVAKAEALSISDSLKSIPNLKQGVAFSLQDSKFNYLTTLDLVKWNGFTLEAGYAGRAKNTGDKVVAVASYEVVNAKKLGITLPILDLIDVRIGGYLALGRVQVGSVEAVKGNNEMDYGISATALTLKW